MFLLVIIRVAFAGNLFLCFIPSLSIFFRKVVTTSCEPFSERSKRELVTLTICCSVSCGIARNGRRKRMKSKMISAKSSTFEPIFDPCGDGRHVSVGQNAVRHRELEYDYGEVARVFEKMPEKATERPFELQFGTYFPEGVTGRENVLAALYFVQLKPGMKIPTVKLLFTGGSARKQGVFDTPPMREFLLNYHQALQDPIKVRRMKVLGTSIVGILVFQMMSSRTSPVGLVKASWVREKRLVLGGQAGFERSVFGFSYEDLHPDDLLHVQQSLFFTLERLNVGVVRKLSGDHFRTNEEVFQENPRLLECVYALPHPFYPLYVDRFGRYQFSEDHHHLVEGAIWTPPEETSSR